MKIAVASDDRDSIATHFGRCAGFLIFEADSGRVESLGFRENNFGHHHRGESERDCNHIHGEEYHDHEGLISILRDCDVVICRGMGRRAMADLRTSGITAAVISEKVSARQAAELYSEGKLDWSTNSPRCSH